MRVKQMIAGCMLLAASVAIGQMNGTQQDTPPKGGAPQKAEETNPNRGEQVFHQNCYRCHQEPRGFSPSVSGTIAKHMRVRASLSAEDYKALLKFLNP
jgi:mono/diheme cytochrome c family protein